MYYLDNNRYPESTNWIKIEEDADINGPFSQALQPYAPTLPQDPLYPEVRDGRVFSYQYRSTPGGTACLIHVELEGGGSYELACLAGSGGITFGGVSCDTDNTVRWRVCNVVPPASADKVNLAGISNACIGKTATTTFKDGTGSILGTASAPVSNIGDDSNLTTVDFIPDVPIGPIEYIDITIDGLDQIPVWDFLPACP